MIQKKKGEKARSFIYVSFWGEKARELTVLDSHLGGIQANLSSHREGEAAGCIAVQYCINQVGPVM